MKNEWTVYDKNVKKIVKIMELKLFTLVDELVESEESDSTVYSIISLEEAKRVQKINRG